MQSSKFNPNNTHLIVGIGTRMLKIGCSDPEMEWKQNVQKHIFAWTPFSVNTNLPADNLREKQNLKFQSCFYPTV